MLSTSSSVNYRLKLFAIEKSWLRGGVGEVDKVLFIALTAGSVGFLFMAAQCKSPHPETEWQPV